jgi:hypothetical protein
MPLPTSGTLSMDNIRVELGVPAQAPMSLQAASIGTYGTINVCSVSRPDGSAPYAISEWYGYCHTCTCTPTRTSTPTVTPTPTLTPTLTSTPTTTPTPTPTTIVSYAFCLGYHASNCNIACSDYLNCNNNQN